MTCVPAGMGTVFCSQLTLPEMGWAAGGFASQVWYGYWVLGAGYGLAAGRGWGKPADTAMLASLSVSEAVLLPPSDEARGEVVRFKVAARLTAHVRHDGTCLEVRLRQSSGHALLDEAALGAVRVADHLWLGTRPGVLAVVPANPWNLTPAIDVPLARSYAPSGTDETISVPGASRSRKDAVFENAATESAPPEQAIAIGSSVGRPRIAATAAGCRRSIGSARASADARGP